MAKQPRKSTAPKASKKKSAAPAEAPDRWTRKRAEAQVRATSGFRCRPVTDEERTEILRLHEAGDTAGRMAQEAKIMKRCGENLTDLIAGAPYDGQEHKDKCPKCGHAFGWRAPWFPGVDGMGAEGPTNE